MEHETKHKDHQRREDEVANFWRTWIREILTKLEKNGQHILSKYHGEEAPRARSNGWLGIREEEKRPWYIDSALVPAGDFGRY